MRHRIESFMTSVNQMARKDGVHLVNNVPFRPRPEAEGRVISDEISEDMVMSFDGAVGFALVEPDEPYAMGKVLDPAVPLHITTETLRQPRAQSLEADLSGMFRMDGEDSAATPADPAPEKAEEPTEPPTDGEPSDPADETDARTDESEGGGAEPEPSPLVLALELSEDANARNVEYLRAHMDTMTVKALKALAEELKIDLGGARAKAAIIEAIVTAP